MKEQKIRQSPKMNLPDASQNRTRSFVFAQDDETLELK